MYSLNFNIPTESLTDVVQALRGYYGIPAGTQAELIAALEADLKKELHRIYTDYMRRKTYVISFD